MQETRDRLVRLYQFWFEVDYAIAAPIGRALLSYDRAQRLIADRVEAGKPMPEGHGAVLEKMRTRA